MSSGYFLLSSAPVSRAKGHSAVGSAAYQSNQKLTHEGQLLCAISVDHRKKLNKGIVTDELRQQLEETHLFVIEADEAQGLWERAISDELREQFEVQGEMLSERLRVWQSEDDSYTIRDTENRQTYHLHACDEGYAISRYNGVTISQNAVAEKIKARNWVIRDGNMEYRVRQVDERRWDKATKKQISTGHKWLDVYANKTHNYSGKGDWVDGWVQVPQRAPEWIQELADKGHAVSADERAKLWQTAEDLENKRDGRPARKILVSLLRDLSDEENKEAVKDFVETHFTSKGIIADIAIHHKKASDGKDNNHAHILIFTRETKADGSFNDKKSKYWNAKARILDWRKGWEEALNRQLEEAGSDTRVDRRSYQDQGMNRDPGKHLGPAAAAMEERGIETDKGTINRNTYHQNAMKASGAYDTQSSVNTWEVEADSPGTSFAVEADETGSISDTGTTSSPESERPMTLDEQHQATVRSAFASVIDRTIQGGMALAERFQNHVRLLGRMLRREERSKGYQEMIKRQGETSHGIEI